jgi:ribosomal protein S18 acetylase RimI-like enzyme
MNRPTLKSDKWLSERIGKAAFHLSGAVSADLPADVSSQITRQPIFVDYKVAVDDVVSLQAAILGGFALIETNLRFSCAVEQIPRCDEPDVRFASPEMIDDVGKIAAESFSCDRFHRDPKIGLQASNNIKQAWAQNFFRGNRGDWMVVVMQDSRPVGFLQLLRSQFGELVIDLIAVDGAHRGRGLARAMISFAAHECGRFDRVIVGTQLANAPSIRLYESMGFRFQSAVHVLHCHGR